MVKVKSLSRVRLFATPWTVAHQALLSMGFPRQEYWSRLPFPDPGIEPMSPESAGGFFTNEPPGEPLQPVTGGTSLEEGQSSHAQVLSITHATPVPQGIITVTIYSVTETGSDPLRERPAG